jgi:hypothetical protein
MRQNRPETDAFPSKTNRSWPVTFANAFQIALDTLWMHKMRSALTPFGIIIDIAAVVLVGASLGVVRESVVRSTTRTFGTDNFLVARVGSIGNLDHKALAEKLRKNPKIYRREAERLASQIEPYARTAQVLQNFSDVNAGKKTFLSAQFTGSNSMIQTLCDISLSAGDFSRKTKTSDPGGLP